MHHTSNYQLSSVSVNHKIREVNSLQMHIFFCPWTDFRREIRKAQVITRNCVFLARTWSSSPRQSKNIRISGLESWMHGSSHFSHSPQNPASSSRPCASHPWKYILSSSSIHRCVRNKTPNFVNGSVYLSHREVRASLVYLPNSEWFTLRLIWN